MGRKASIYSLPADLRAELKQRIIDYGFAGYEAHEAWLAEQGYSIGKSSIHRLGVSIKAAIEADLRMRCLAVAARYSSAETISDNASALLKWVKGG